MAITDGLEESDGLVDEVSVVAVVAVAVDLLGDDRQLMLDLLPVGDLEQALVEPVIASAVGIDVDLTTLGLSTGLLETTSLLCGKNLHKGVSLRTEETGLRALTTEPGERLRRRVSRRPQPSRRRVPVRSRVRSAGPGPGWRRPRRRCCWVVGGEPQHHRRCR